MIHATKPLKGKTDAEVAIAVGVGRDTVNRWRNHNREFVVALNEQRNQLENNPQFRVSRLLAWSLEVIESALTKEDIVAAIAVAQAFKQPEGNTSSSSSVPQLTLLCQSRQWETKVSAEQSHPNGTAS